MPDGDLLALHDVTIAFGGVRAVDGLSFSVRPGSIVSLIGPNGAGKTTALNSISGFVRARGSIRFDGRELLALAAHRRAGLGIGRTFQNLQLFDDLTLLENVLVGEHARLGGNVFLDVLRFPVAAREREARDRARALLAMLDIAQYADRPASSLPFGVQKLAGVARALAIQPRLLLLDEPAAGLNRHESEALAAVIVGLREKLGLTVLMVEHNMRLVMGASDHIVVLANGRRLMEGTPHQVATHPEVIAAYLGASTGAAGGEVARDFAHRA